jgi:hypothetical protein
MLLEILLGCRLNECLKKSVWAINSRYYIEGKSVSLPKPSRILKYVILPLNLPMITVIQFLLWITLGRNIPGSLPIISPRMGRF